MVTFIVSSQSTTQLKRRGFSQLKVNLDNSRDDRQDGKDKLVKSSTLIGSLMPRELKEAQENFEEKLHGRVLWTLLRILKDKLAELVAAYLNLASV
ncbi:hypothetical protein Tco_0736575 [Tanacetum coccineum]